MRYHGPKTPRESAEGLAPLRNQTARSIAIIHRIRHTAQRIFQMVQADVTAYGLQPKGQTELQSIAAAHYLVSLCDELEVSHNTITTITNVEAITLANQPPPRRRDRQVNDD